MAPSRLEIAERLRDVPVADTFGTQAEYEAHCDVIEAAAAELDKRCGNCKSFDRDPSWSPNADKDCLRRDGMCGVPIDGSGFCHRWEPKAEGR